MLLKFTFPVLCIFAVYVHSKIKYYISKIVIIQTNNNKYTNV